MKTAILFFLSLLIMQPSFAQDTPSTCYGTTQSGHLKNGWQLPSEGNNFEAYSSLGTSLGRTYVHSKVYAAVVGAYKILETSAPDKIFVYGESGLEEGGQFKPHKTHRNGLSVDFFVPVVIEKGISVTLPTNPLNKLGYDIEFDSKAKYKDLKIDFEAMAQNLVAIKKAADKENVGIRVVIFDNEFQKLLFATKTGRNLLSTLTFSVKKPWVRHDEHYHIDFVVKCEN